MMGCDHGSWSAPQDSKTVRHISGSGSGAAAATAARPMSKWRRSSKLEWGWASARASVSEASLPPCAATKDAEVEKVEKVSIGVDAITIGFSQEDEDPDTCYICLSSEGPMLVNMCACRSLRAHRSCLLELTRRQTGPPVCGVCRQVILPGGARALPARGGARGSGLPVGQDPPCHQPDRQRHLRCSPPQSAPHSLLPLLLSR